MSAMGQKQPFPPKSKESAFGGTTDLSLGTSNVRFVPKGDIGMASDFEILQEIAILTVLRPVNRTLGESQLNRSQTNQTFYLTCVDSCSILARRLWSSHGTPSGVTFLQKFLKHISVIHFFSFTENATMNGSSQFLLLFC